MKTALAILGPAGQYILYLCLFCYNTIIVVACIDYLWSEYIFTNLLAYSIG